MARFYCGRIKRGKLAIEDVPERLRDQVQALLNADNQG